MHVGVLVLLTSITASGRLSAMSTESLQPTLTLTTAELLTRCEKETGARFTVHQLGDWATRGLLPPSKAGKGRGRHIGGSEPRRWDAECLPRLCVIARSRTGDKHISISRAAYALAAEGYAGDATLLRRALSDCLYMLHTGIADAIKWKRPFLDDRRLSAEEKRRRLHRSELHKYRHIAPPIQEVAEQTKAVLLGLAAASRDSALEKMLSTFSYEQIKASLEQSSDEELVQIHRVMRERLLLVLPPMLPLLSLLLTAGMALPADPPEWGRLQAALDGLAQLFAVDDAGALATRLRLPLMLAMLHVRSQQIEHVDELALAALHHLTTLLSSEMGEAGVVLQAVLERVKKDMNNPPDVNTAPDVNSALHVTTVNDEKDAIQANDAGLHVNGDESQHSEAERKEADIRTGI